MGRAWCGGPVLLVAGLAAAAPAAAGTLLVTGSNPPPNAARIAPSTAITVRFDRSLDPATVDAASFRAYGRSSGPVIGSFELVAGGTAARLRPAAPFAAGETVLVNLASTIAGLDGVPLGPGGHAFHFTVAAEPSAGTFTEIDVVSVVTEPGVGTRLYGGQASDLDRDGWLDLATVNEDTADARVLMNRDDGSGSFEPVRVPTAPIGPGASPNEAADFDGDGWPDLAAANQQEGTVSVLLGEGDGDFAPEVVIAVGAQPRGLAVLDVDGDADLDLVAANYQPGDLARILNLGGGAFSAAAAFDSGTGYEWALGAGDFDEDGRVDLAVGVRSPDQVRILRNLGNGSFALAGTAAAGGAPWQLAVGDVDGDGHLDVAVANGPSANGAVLRGLGDGTLEAAAVYPLPGLALATDLADLDGDGDLDWALAFYNGSPPGWRLFANDGDGAFAFWRGFTASAAGSCTVPFDFDNDRDLDLALLDEEADEIRLERNDGAPGTIFTDRFEGGDTTPWSAAQL